GDRTGISHGLLHKGFASRDGRETKRGDGCSDGQRVSKQGILFAGAWKHVLHRGSRWNESTPETVLEFGSALSTGRGCQNHFARAHVQHRRKTADGLAVG